MRSRTGISQNASIQTGLASRCRRTYATCLKIGVALAVAILSIYLAIGLITVIVWSVRNHAAVVSLFELSGMETGSRILTTVAMLIWLPNVMLWLFPALRRRIRHR